MQLELTKWQLVHKSKTTIADFCKAKEIHFIHFKENCKNITNKLLSKI